MTVQSRTVAAGSFLVLALFAAAACSGGGDGDETPTVPTIDTAAEKTQLAVNTEEAGALATATRAPGPVEQPTLAAGTVRLATTNGLVESGLLDVLVPMFGQETGYTLQVVAFPSSDESVEQASAGNADAVLSNALDAELGMIGEGYGIERAAVMNGDFVIVGPAADRALVREQERADDALRAIHEVQSSFITSIEGTAAHAHELRVWAALDLPDREGKWYQSSGVGVSGTLALASERQAYTMSDRASFLAAEDALNVQILLAGDPEQIDPYHVIVVNPDVHPTVNAVGARAFAAFLTRPDIQQIIGEYRVAEFGEPVFVPVAGNPAPAP